MTSPVPSAGSPPAWRGAKRPSCMTDEVLRARLRMLREEGVTYYEDGVVKVVIGPRATPRADDAPLSPLERRAQDHAGRDVDDLLFRTPGFQR